MVALQKWTRMAGGYMWHSKDYRDTTDERKNLLCIDKGIRLIRILEPGLPAFQKQDHNVDAEKCSDFMAQFMSKKRKSP